MPPAGVVLCFPSEVDDYYYHWLPSVFCFVLNCVTSVRCLLGCRRSRNCFSRFFLKSLSPDTHVHRLANSFTDEKAKEAGEEEGGGSVVPACTWLEGRARSIHPPFPPSLFKEQKTHSIYYYENRARCALLTEVNERTERCVCV